MKMRYYIFVFLLVFIVGCVSVKEPATLEEPNFDIGKQEIALEDDTVDSISDNEKILYKQKKDAQEPQEYRLEIPSQSEREKLPECNGVKFTSYPVDIKEISSITPLGNLGPPGHTFPTQHPHIHVGEYGSEKAIDLFAPADIYLTLIAWSDGQTQDPRDYVLYFALCKDVIAYYNHVKTISSEIQEITDRYECEKFSSGGLGCTKIIDLDKTNEGTRLGTVGHKQGNFDFGLIDLRKPLDYIKPDKYAERDRYLQCAFDYYPEEKKEKFYSLINRDEGGCGEVMQDVPGTLKGNWFHDSVNDEFVINWDLYLSFADHFKYADVQVVSIAGIFTEPSLYHFKPRDTGTVNRNFVQVSPGNEYCYQSENVGFVNSQWSGKIVVKMVDSETLHIAHQGGSCNGNEQLNNFEVYRR